MNTELWKRIQRHVGVIDDGKPGDATAKAIAVKFGLEGPPPPPPANPVAKPPGAANAQFDERTERNIATLLPPAQKLARRFMTDATLAMLRHDIEPRIISGTRTYAEQDALYAKGRTAPGSKVTNARGGFSNHNFGIAFDIGLFKGGKYLAESPHYATLGPVGESVGLKWGGRWKGFPDQPHYEYDTGFTLAEMRERVKAGKPIA